MLVFLGTLFEPYYGPFRLLTSHVSDSSLSTYPVSLARLFSPCQRVVKYASHDPVHACPDFDNGYSFRHLTENTLTGPLMGLSSHCRYGSAVMP
jgi:hypothetical protein